MLTGGAEAARGRRGWNGVGLGTLPLVSIMIPPIGGVELDPSKSRGKVLKCGVFAQVFGWFEFWVAADTRSLWSLWTFIES